ncbi:hypothetical protein [Fodinicola feengrottensis]|uniref:hypothetical protein n=1 Tax=Fodinicola feengrottensis TaxID=435914 RepID=UPI0013D82D34|nr:hypothetical protein [Fodinicola feengrottensis]
MGVTARRFRAVRHDCRGQRRPHHRLWRQVGLRLDAIRVKLPRDAVRHDGRRQRRPHHQLRRQIRLLLDGVRIRLTDTMRHDGGWQRWRRNGRLGLGSVRVRLPSAVRQRGRGKLRLGRTAVQISTLRRRRRRRVDAVGIGLRGRLLVNAVGWGSAVSCGSTRYGPASAGG